MFAILVLLSSRKRARMGGQPRPASIVPGDMRAGNAFEPPVSKHQRAVVQRISHPPSCFHRSRRPVLRERVRAASNKTPAGCRPTNRSSPVLLPSFPATCAPGTRSGNQCTHWLPEHFLRSARRPETRERFRRAQDFSTQMRPAERGASAALKDPKGISMH